MTAVMFACAVIMLVSAFMAYAARRSGSVVESVGAILFLLSGIVEAILVIVHYTQCP
jgi:hypothetical protein